MTVLESLCTVGSAKKEAVTIKASNGEPWLLRNRRIISRTATAVAMATANRELNGLTPKIEKISASRTGKSGG